MKKVLTLLLTAAIIICMFSACSTGTSGNTASASTAASTGTAASASAASSGTAASASSAASSGSASASASGSGYKIGWTLMTTSDPVIAQTVKDAQARADELGIELWVSSADNDASKQMDAVENFIESGCNAIIIQAIDATSMSEEAKKAMDKGIKVVAYGIGLDNCDCWYKNDNTVTGTAIGTMASDWINQNLNGEANVCIIGYSMMQVLVERADAIEAALKANCKSINVVASFDAIDSESGMSNMESVLAAHPEVNVLCSISDGPAVGAYEAVKAAGLDNDKFGIFGSDLSLVAVDLINKGTCYRGTIDCDNIASGKTSIDIAYNLITGAQQDNVVVMGCKAVTSANISDYTYLLN